MSSNTTAPILLTNHTASIYSLYTPILNIRGSGSDDSDSGNEANDERDDSRDNSDSENERSDLSWSTSTFLGGDLQGNGTAWELHCIAHTELNRKDREQIYFTSIK
jgi:hypothetical protein